MGSVAIGVDFGGQFVKFAKLRKRGQSVAIERLVKIRRSSTETVEQIAAGLKEKNLHVSSSVMGVSGRGAIIRYTTVPPVPAFRLKMIMDYEIGELAGKSSEAVSSDYKVLNVPREVSQDFTVMVAMSKDDYVRESMSELASAGVGVAQILPTPLALCNVIIGLGYYEEGKTCLAVDIGATNVDIAILNNRDLFFARSIGRGADDFTEALSESLAVGFPEAERIKASEGMIATTGWRSEREKQISDTLAGAADRLYATLNSSVGFARKQLKLKNLKVDRIILLGGGSDLPGLPEYLTRSFDTEVVAPGLSSILKNPQNSINQPHFVLALPPEDIAGASPELREFSTALGLALSEIDASSYSMDLIPAEEKKKRAFKERTVFMYAAGAILLAFLLVRFVAAWGQQSNVQGRQTKLEERLDEANERLAALKELNEENSQVTSAIDRLAKLPEQGSFVTQLLFLMRDSEVTPGEIRIKEVLLRELSEDAENPSGPPSVLIRGRVHSSTGNEYDIVRQFRDQMLKTELIKSAEIDPSRTLMDRDEFKFEIAVSAGRMK